MAKRLIRLFGFVAHDAPGEAEAECALLQRNGIVDAVLSEDVDTIMFGCTKTLRNWSSEGTKGAKTPTHVSMYDTQELCQGPSGLDREGMVLVALMSGGDYLPEGIPGAGVKLACEAARAGFGKSLCQLKRSESSELASWKERLTYELRHNESGFFRTRHKALTIPDDFPGMDILRYYTHPVVSPTSTLDRLKQQIWDQPIDVQGLREFVRETFDWTYRIGAVKFIRVLAPCLLVRMLMQRAAVNKHQNTDTSMLEKEETELVMSIKTRRAHFSTDATPELRVSFVPTRIVGYDFQQEPDEVIDFGREGLALNSDDEIEELQGDAVEGDSGAKPGARKQFSPTEPDLLWVPEAIARLGIPFMVEKWEEAQRAKAIPRTRAKTSKQKSRTGETAVGALNKFVKITKNNVPHTTETIKLVSAPGRSQLSPIPVRNTLNFLPTSSQNSQPLPRSSQEPQKSHPTRTSKPPTSNKSRSGKKLPEEPKVDINTNPWTIASSQASPRVARTTKSTKTCEPILITSSPVASPSKGVTSPVSSKDGNDNDRDEIDLFPTRSSCPAKRRSLTPPIATLDEGDVTGYSVADELSPAPASIEKPLRKFSRAGSLPLDSPPRRSQKQVRGLKRAQTVAIEALPAGSEDESDDNNDFELPPISSFISRIHGGNKAYIDSTLPSTAVQSNDNSSIIIIGSGVGATDEEETINPPNTTTTTTTMQKNMTKPEKRQTTLKQTHGIRMTKLYVPRKSEPGFFKEIDVSVDEADALKEEYATSAASAALKDGTGSGSKRTGSVWRRSDVSCIDLTGE